MIIYGYAKDVKYGRDGTMYVRVRIPQIHGPQNRQEYRGQQSRNYTWDKDLPYYPANILSAVPQDGDIVELQTPNGGSTEFTVSGLTGANSSGIETNLHTGRYE